MFLKENFVKVLNMLLKQKNITQTVLSKALGIKQQSVSKFVQGNSLPSIENLCSMADFFNVSVDFLLGRGPLYKNPVGNLEYCFKDESGFLMGKFSYVFGLAIESEDDSNWQTPTFLYLEEVEGTFLKRILNSHSQFEFLSLVYLLNNKLQLNYDAFSNNGISIIIKLEESYMELHLGTWPTISVPISEKYIKSWIALPVEEQINLLNRSVDK